MSLYDIHRGIERELGWAPDRMSLNASVALDRRCCWAGRGLYGLWRHGLVPGPRKSRDVARLVLHAHEKPLEAEEITFALRHLGYRFVPSTLPRILNATVTIKLDGYGAYRVSRSPVDTMHLRTDISLGIEEFRVVRRQLQRHTRAALRERRRRLALVRGLAANDPIYQEGDFASGLY